MSEKEKTRLSYWEGVNQTIIQLQKNDVIENLFFFTIIIITKKKKKKKKILIIRVEHFYKLN